MSETYKTPGGGTKEIPGKPGVAPTPPQPPLACSPFLGPVIMGVTCSFIQ